MQKLLTNIKNNQKSWKWRVYRVWEEKLNKKKSVNANNDDVNDLKLYKLHKIISWKDVNLLNNK